MENSNRVASYIIRTQKQLRAAAIERNNLETKKMMPQEEELYNVSEISLIIIWNQERNVINRTCAKCVILDIGMKVYKKKKKKKNKKFWYVVKFI